MADGTSIEWTDATLFGEALPWRCSTCRLVKPVSDFNVDRSRFDGHSYVCRECDRTSPTNVPNRIERAAARKGGQAWCRECAAWRPLSEVKQGLCRDHRREADRRLYRDNPAHRERRKKHSLRRKRGVERVPTIAREYLMELFEEGCAYCSNPAETWDHVIPVAKGGTTRPDNILPCCIPCNSSKRDRDLDEWLIATGRELSERAVDHLSHYQVL